MLEWSSVSFYPLVAATVARGFGVPAFGFSALLIKELRHRHRRKLQDNFMRVGEKNRAGKL